MIKKIITYFIITTAILFALRYIHYKGLLRQTKGYYGTYNTAFLTKNNFNILFLGSSRVEMHYNTKIFDSLTGLNSFNLSLAGASPQVAFAALKAYLVNSQAPKYLIYEVDYHNLKYKSTEVKEFNNYFPFLRNTELRYQFNKIDSRINHFYINPYYSLPYVGFKNLSTSLHGWLKIPNQIDSLYYKGYFKESLRPNLKFTHINPHYTFFNITNRNYLDSIILLCKKNNTSITLVSSPAFGGGLNDIKNKQQQLNQINNIAKINHIQYFNLTSLAFCNQRNLFIDYYHMNYLGASQFSILFSHFFNNKVANFSLK